MSGMMSECSMAEVFAQGAGEEVEVGVSVGECG
jgi:hypothetical protein